MSGRHAFLGAAILAACSSPALADEGGADVEEFAPSSHWHLDYAESRCRIVRTFGEGDDKTVLYMEQLQPSDRLQWVVAGGAADRLGSRRRYEVQFGPEFEPFEIRTEAQFTLGEYGASVRGYFDPNGADQGERAVALEHPGWSADNPIGMPSLSEEAGKKIEWLQFSRKGRHYRLMTGEMGPVFAAMNACMNDLVEHWGADPEVLRTRVTPPKVTNLTRVAAAIQNDYPNKAERRGESADLHLRVMVEANGRVSSCHMTDITEAENFPPIGCMKFQQMARFEPARDAQGNAVPSYFVTTISYRMY